MHPPQTLPIVPSPRLDREPILFANVISRLDRIEARVDAWLYKRRTVTLKPITQVVDTTEQPTEPLDAGVIRTVARVPPRR